MQPADIQPPVDPTFRWLPLARYNLRYNPFGELTATQRVAAAVVRVDEYVGWLNGQRRALQFIADCGRGKTTHLLALRDRLPDAAYVYLPPDGPTPPIPQGSPLLIDEAQRLGWWLRWRVFQRGGPLVLGTHVDLIRPLRRRGYEVRTIAVAADLDCKRLSEILNRRIELARLGPGPLPVIQLDEAERLIARFGNDIRSMESYLYTRLQENARFRRGSVQFVD